MAEAVAVDLPRTSQGRSTFFSAHSRGVQLFERQQLLDCGFQAANAARQIRDVGSAFFTLLFIQTWLTCFTAAMTIASISFFCYGPSDEMFPLDLSYIGFLIILPCLILLVMVYHRREAALRDLAQVKSGLLFCWLKCERDSSTADTGAKGLQHSLIIQQTISTLLDGMRTFLSYDRFYARSYPYFNVRTKMIRCGRDRTRQIRQIYACFKKLSMLCEGCDNYLHSVHLSFERMANVKEFRTPQALRATIRVFVPVVLSVYIGPFWSSFYRATRSFAFSLLVGLLLNMVIVALLNAAIQLEDPFDNVGLDGIYADEAFSEIEQAMLVNADAELASSGQPLSHSRIGVHSIPALNGSKTGASQIPPPQSAQAAARLSMPVPQRQSMQDLPLSTD